MDRIVRIVCCMSRSSSTLLGGPMGRGTDDVSTNLRISGITPSMLSRPENGTPERPGASECHSALPSGDSATSHDRLELLSPNELMGLWLPIEPCFFAPLAPALTRVKLEERGQASIGVTVAPFRLDVGLVRYCAGRSGIIAVRVGLLAIETDANHVSNIGSPAALSRSAFWIGARLALTVGASIRGYSTVTHNCVASRPTDRVQTMTDQPMETGP
jgi:hypothetical protein